MISITDVLTLSSKLSYNFWELSNALAHEPEVSSKEYNSSLLHTQTLEKFGFRIEKPFAATQTAFRGTFGKRGPTLSFLIEYDALEGIGHGCGHNLSGALTSLSAVLLSRFAPLLPPIKITALGTPSEEIGDFKAHLAEKGHLRGTDLALMAHVTSGKSNVSYRSLAMSTRDFCFTTDGKALPWGQLMGPNPLAAFADFVKALEKLQTQGPHGALVSGIVLNGEKDPFEATSQITGRFVFCSAKKTLIDKFLEDVYKEASRIAQNRGLQTNHKIVGHDLWEFLPNRPAEEALIPIFKSMHFEVEEDNEWSFEGASDAGNISQICPMVHPFISISKKPIQRHTKEFAKATKKPEAHKALVVGAAALAMLAIEFASNEAFRIKIKNYFLDNKKRL